MRLRTTDRPAAISDLSFGTRLALALLPIFCSVIVWIFDTAANMVEKPIVTAEQHIARIGAIAEKHLEAGRFTHQTGFSVSLLHSFDCPAEPHETCPDYDYFLIDFEPYGYMFGFIRENKYYYDLYSYFLNEEDGTNPFARAGIAEDCRYTAYMWRGLHKFAARTQDGLVDIETGRPVSKEEKRAWSSNAGLFQSALPERAKYHAYLIFEFD